MNGLEVDNRKLKTGYSILDKLILGNSIITLRSPDDTWLFNLVSNMIVKNQEPGKKILYLHWVDYHKRYWTIDTDYIFYLGKLNSVNLDSLAENTLFLRVFTRDNNEVKENWDQIFTINNLNFIILDSISELFEDKKENSKPITYSIGKFVQLCIKNNCTGIILDRMHKPIHTYLGHVSSIILEFVGERNDIVIKVLKHPCLGDETIDFPKNNQYKLRRWM